MILIKLPSTRSFLSDLNLASVSLLFLLFLRTNRITNPTITRKIKHETVIMIISKVDNFEQIADKEQTSENKEVNNISSNTEGIDYIRIKIYLKVL